MFPFGGVAKQSLAKLWNNLSEHPKTESTLLEEEGLFQFFLPKVVLWMNAMISCCALSCWAQFYILTDSALRAKDFSFFLIPSSRSGLFAKKMQQNGVLLSIAVLPGNI